MKSGIYYCGIVGIMLCGGTYGGSIDTAPTSKAYVDYQLSTRQDKIPAQDSEKVLTYGSTDGSIGSRDVVMDPDDVTTNNTGIMTVNATDVIYDKQNIIINLPSSNVLSATNDNGRVSSRHIYDSTNNRFGDGLVDAGTVNSATTTALNQKFTQVDTSGNPSANGTLWRVNSSATNALPITTTLDASIAGQDYCYRSLDGQSRSNGTCSADTLSYLGANSSSNKSGKWGVVFPYGDVSGISVCSNVAPDAAYKYDTSSDGTFDYYNWGNVANGTKSQTLTTQYNSQSGIGTLSSDQTYCWCKLENPAASSWVFRYSYDGSSSCAGNCASLCASLVHSFADFRGAVFGAVAQ
jgi:hypothetical protein